MHKQKLWISLAALACTFSAGIGIHTSVKNTQAAADISAFAISKSAIRTNSPSGLRFKVDCPVDKQDIEEAYTNITFTSSVQTAENPDGEAIAYSTNVDATVWRSEGDGWNTVLLEIPASDYAT